MFALLFPSHAEVFVSDTLLVLARFHAPLSTFASAGEMVQEKLTGQTVIEQLTSGHISPFGDGQGAF